jgi:hypothetical protein
MPPVEAWPLSPRPPGTDPVALAQPGGNVVGPHPHPAAGAVDADAAVAADIQHIAELEGFEVGAQVGIDAGPRRR